MSGLDNPRGLTFVVGENNDDWALYVAESGSGGSGPCAMVRGAQQCAGATGAVTRYQGGVQQRIVTGLPCTRRSTVLAPPVRTTSRSPQGRDSSPSVSAGRCRRSRCAICSVKSSAGLCGWAPATNGSSTRTSPRTSNCRIPAAALPTVIHMVWSAEQGGASSPTQAATRCLALSNRWRFQLIAIFPSRAQGRSTDAVSNSVARGPDGAFYVGELTGVPFVPNTSNVYRVVPGQQPVVYCSGFSFILDLDFDQHGNLYVLEHTSAPFPTGPGTLYRIGTTAAGPRSHRA